MIPTFLYQVRDDLYTRPDDIQAMFDNIPIANKKLHWIEGTTRRWDGYTYSSEPEQMLHWFARFNGLTGDMPGAVRRRRPPPARLASGRAIQRASGNRRSGAPTGRPQRRPVTAGSR
ncbi:hypothetical protein [Sinorhizobium meliloti]|uniref:hypothetical protein n=1 Tax=Rhizobium meliloti TaxID=382 RepID=UPI001F2839CB|nr:hypothetical protein [Sinorhizobium meliloti]